MPYRVKRRTEQQSHVACLANPVLGRLSVLGLRAHLSHQALYVTGQQRWRLLHRHSHLTWTWMKVNGQVLLLF